MNRPIIFSGPMVRAILDGRKTQTRRVVKGMALDWIIDVEFSLEFVCHPDNGLCPYGNVGTLLWVRETFAPHPDGGHVYRATDPDWQTTEGWVWRPSIYMPRFASRITLEVTGVYIERLHDISETDALAEGVDAWPDGNFKAYGKHSGKFRHAKDSFSSLWESINGHGSWDANPFVWVIKFKRIVP